MRRDLPPDFEARGSWRLLVPCLVTVVLRSRVRVYGDLLEYRSAFRTRVVPLGRVTGIDWVKGRNAYEKAGLVVSHPGGRIRLSSYTFGFDPLRSLADGLLARCPGVRPVSNWSPTGGSTH